MPKIRKEANLNIDDKWTSLAPLAGWRHFRIATRRQAEDGLEVELMAVCDRAVRIWLRAGDLKNADAFLPGWR